MSDQPHPWWKLLYNHNPFYVISTVLMLLAVRSAYGEMRIGEINCWLVMSVLAGYTVLLAGIGIGVIRLGKVWDDARSILLLLLLLFLSISVSMDDLFVKMETRAGGLQLVWLGIAFSAGVTEAVLLLTGIRLRILYRLPMYLFIGLFFATPWYFSPEMHPRSPVATEWLLSLFPLVVSALVLSLLPAVWRGPQYVKTNGTPWKWPLYPWSIFVILIVAAMMRTYAVCMTFGPTGPIWKTSASGGLGIVFSTIWGTWFLVPICFSILLLVLEAGVIVRHAKQQRLALILAPFVLLLSLPSSSAPVFWSHWNGVTEAVGSPIWLSCIMLACFYAWAYLRRVPGADLSFGAALLLFVYVGPRTSSLSTLQPPNPAPLLLVGLGVLWSGLRTHDSRRVFAGASLASWIPLLFVPQDLTPINEIYLAAGIALLLSIVVSVFYKDQFANTLRVAGAFGAFISVWQILGGQIPGGFSGYELFAFACGITLALAVIALVLDSRIYFAGTCGDALLLVYYVARIGFYEAVAVFGMRAVSAFCWSFAMLGFALWISLHKARKLRISEVKEQPAVGMD